MRQQRGVLRKPTPINPIEDVVSQTADFRMFFKVLSTSKNAAEQNRRINRGNFRVPNSFARVQISEMIKESPMRRHLLPQKTKREQNPIARLVKRNESALLRDAERRQPKARGGNAGNHARVLSLYLAPVFDQAGLRACLVPKVLKVPLLEFI